MLRLGKFTEAIQAGDERRSSLRRENAALYSDFIGQNPGASMDERTDFANNLIQDTGVGSRGLPTRAAMQSSVDTYQRAQAAAAAGRARAAERNRLQAERQKIQDTEMILGNAVLTGETLEATGERLAIFGLPTDDMSIYGPRIVELGFRKWQDDQRSSIETYLNDPTEARYQQLLASSGEALEERVSGQYSGQYIAYNAEQTRRLNAEHRQLALNATDETSYARAVESLNAEYPQSVLDAAAPVIAQSLEDFTGRQSAAVDAEVVNMRGKLEILSREALSPEDYAIKRDAIVREYSENAQTQAVDVIAGTNTEAQRQRDVVLDANTQRFITESQYNLTALSMNPNTTQEALTAQLVRDNAVAAENGFTLPPNYGEAAQARFDVEQGKRDGVLDAQITAAVSDQTNAAIDAAAGDKSLDAVVARLEAELSASQGREVQLDPAQIAILQEQIDAQRTQLQKDMEALASGRVEDVSQYASAVAQTKAEFVSNFVTQMEASGNGAINNAEARFGELAEQTYDNIISAIREQNNQEESSRIRTAVTEMDAARDTVDVGATDDDFDKILFGPGVLGDLDDNARGPVSARIKTDLLSKANAFAQQLDIPLTEELYTQMALILAEAAGSERHVAGETFDPALIKDAMVQAFIRTVDNMPNSGLEILAFQEALAVSGVDNLGTADAEQERAFGNAYRAARRQMATEAFDVYSPSFAEDISRSNSLVEDATSANTDNAPKFAAVISSIEVAMELDAAPLGLDTARSHVAVSNEGIALLPSLNANIEDIDTELSRLMLLSNTSIYATSEHAQAVRDRMTQLTEAREASISTIAQIGLVKERIDQIQAKILADQETLRAQTELDEWQVIGGDTMFDPDPSKRVSTRSLSPRALELLRMELEQRRNPPPTSNLPY